MTINANTKIGTLLKQNPEALEAIIRVSPKFSKLRNPILRKVMAGRTSIAMASKVAGCSVEDFFKELKPLGFDIDAATPAIEDEESISKALPEFMQGIKPEQMIELDVRPVIESGEDPLSIIISKVKSLPTGSVLKIINTFEPTPLMLLLGKQGLESYAETMNDELVYTYFYKKNDKVSAVTEMPVAHAEDWDTVLEKYRNNLVRIDVRDLEMPLPMHTILESLATLPPGNALYVFHKRIPVFLLPELESQQYNYRIKEISDGEVHLLIFKN